jgi:hypothetical protein
MTLPAVLTYDRKDTLDAADMAAVLERGERMLTALRHHCAMALHACDEPPGVAEELLENLWELVETMPPPLRGARLTFDAVQGWQHTRMRRWSRGFS